MARLTAFGVVFVALICATSVHGGLRALKQANQNPSDGASITVTASDSDINAIAITPVLPYPQTDYYCNVSGDSRLAVQAYFPLNVNVPVGVSSKVIFVNVSDDSGSSDSSSAASPTASAGRKLLQTYAPIEFISNNGSTGDLSITDTGEGVFNLVFSPTYAGQTASFSGALQVAITTTNDGLGTPASIPYVIDSNLSPNCKLQVNFNAV